MVGFLGGAASPLPISYGSGERCNLPQRGQGKVPENLDFGAFSDLRYSRQNGQLAFESGGGATSESGGTCPSAPT